MDSRTMAVMLGFFVCCWCQLLLFTVSGNMVFPVEHKFKGKDWCLRDLVQHDSRRHGRMLDTVDLPIGGDGSPINSGLYYTKIKIGNPGSDFHVQVDTGSDVLWINCAGCEKCPTESKLGFDLSFYNPTSSSTSKNISCEDDACKMIYSGALNGCTPDMPCLYEITYGDQSTTTGNFIKDVLHYDKASGNQQPSSGSDTIVFGCAAKQGGDLSASNDATDGIMGFGKDNSSVISQLAAANKVKNTFCHCLNGRDGGGIFAIGEVVEPKISMTPYVPEQTHYNVLMSSVDIGDEVIDLSSGDTEAIIDSGTTLAFMPNNVYTKFMDALHKMQPHLKITIQDESFKCFEYSDDVDEGFPDVKLHFTKSLTFNVRPHDYLFQIKLVGQEEKWCISWMPNGDETKDGKKIFLLGDMVLSNKLVVYDIEKQSIGWTEYNCSSSIELKDGAKGSVQPVEAQDISSDSTLLSSSSLPRTIFVVVLIATIIRYL